MREMEEQKEIARKLLRAARDGDLGEYLRVGVDILNAAHKDDKVCIASMFKKTIERKMAESGVAHLGANERYALKQFLEAIEKALA